MNKRLMVLVSISVVAVVGLVGGYFWMFETKPPAPKRPAGVPPSASWVGWNKGEWIDCKALPQAGRFRCEVFADVSGDRLSSGEYTLERAAAAGEEMKPTSFDGEAIGTSAGKLVPYGMHTYFGGGKDSWTKDFGPPPSQG